MTTTAHDDLAASMGWWQATHQHRLLTADEEQALGRAARGGDIDARNDLVAHNVRLAIHEARKSHYQGRGLALDDLIQHAIIGLITAADKFDPTKGYRFSTYATFWARQAIDRALVNHGTTVRIPAHMDERIARVARAAADYAARTGDEADDATLAHLAGVTLAQLRAARAAQRVQHAVSLDAALDSPAPGQLRQADKSMADLLADPTADPAADVEATDLSTSLRAALRRLPERHRAVVALRYGLDDNRPRTLAEIGAALGVTRQRAEQIHAEAIRELRDRDELRELLAA